MTDGAGLRDRWQSPCGCLFVGLAVAGLCTKHANNLRDVPNPATIPPAERYVIDSGARR